jgi:hypothetical protein
MPLVSLKANLWGRGIVSGSLHPLTRVRQMHQSMPILMAKTGHI